VPESNRPFGVFFKKTSPRSGCSGREPGAGSFVRGGHATVARELALSAMGGLSHDSSSPGPGAAPGRRSASASTERT
jgi:hypothetical protein